MKTSLCEKIRLCRLSKGYSQEYMACMLNMEQPTYCRIETGHRELRISELERIAILLEKPVSYFFEDNTLANP